MSWNRLRHLTPLTEHPSSSPSLSPAISDGSLSLLEATVRLDRSDTAHHGTCQLLAAFLDYLVGAGQINMANDILSCKDDKQLVTLANHVLDAILKPFLLAGGHAPSPLTTPPSQDASAAIDAALSSIESSTRAEQSRLRRDCLSRDGYQCVYTGTWDFASVTKGTAHPPPGQKCDYIDCAHVIPFALGSFDDSDVVQTRNKAIIWFAIHRYFPELKGKIDASSINQRGNAFCLGRSLHGFFGEYQVGFSPRDGRDNEYEYVQLSTANLAISPSKTASSIVTFTSADNSVPLPDPDFLRVHLAVARILDVSGFGRIISRALYDADLVLDCHGLHPSGSTDVGTLLSRFMLIDIDAEASKEKGSRFSTEDNALKKPGSSHK